MPKRKSKNFKKIINQVAGATPGTSGSMAVWRADLKLLLVAGLVLFNHLEKQHI